MLPGVLVPPDHLQPMCTSTLSGTDLSFGFCVSCLVASMMLSQKLSRQTHNQLARQASCVDTVDV